MKIIYQPKGAAGEYAKYAVNFVVGCSYRCKYCYNNKGITAKALGGNPRWVQGKNDYNFLDLVHQFEDDIKTNLDVLRKDGVFFSFTSDPLQDEWSQATYFALDVCARYNVPATVLTKNGYIISKEHMMKLFGKLIKKRLLTFGVTLTGMRLVEEPYAPPESGRLIAITKLREMGAKTFVSFEPVIKFNATLGWLLEVAPIIDEARIGLLTPVKMSRYPAAELFRFYGRVNALSQDMQFTVMWKKSFMDLYQRYKESTSNE